MRPAQAARLTHSALRAASAAKLAVVGYSRSDTYLHLAPLFHVGGLSSALAVLARSLGWPRQILNLPPSLKALPESRPPAGAMSCFQFFSLTRRLPHWLRTA